MTTASSASTSSSTASSLTNYLSSTQQSTSQVSGLVSGLDTASLISQLMTAAAIPQTNLKNQVTADQAKLTAYQAVNTKLAALQTASEALSQPSGWGLTTASSSDSSVTATTSASSTAGSFTFDVLNTASAQSMISLDTYGSTGATVATRNLTFTDASGTSTPIKVGGGSLNDVVSAINAANLGVSASAVKVDATHYRLQVSGNNTGAASSFTLSGITDGLDTLSSPLDATIALGGNHHYTVTSSTNTFSGLTNGLSLTVTKPATGVTVNVGADTGTLVKNVQAMVDAANAVLTEISNDTAYDTTTNTGSALTGDGTVRQITNNLLSSISSAVGGKSLANVGLSVDKDGQIDFDSSAFLKAYSSDPAGTQGIFTTSSTITGLPTSGISGSISLRRSSSTTQDGTYPVHVTQAATKSSTTYDVSNGLAAGTVLTFGRGGSTAAYTVTGTETPAQLAAAITAASQQAGLNLNATDDGSALTVNSSGYGGISAFTFAVNGQSQSVAAGLDVAGTINGTSAIGSGQILGAPDLSPPLGGLTLTVGLTPADLLAGGADSAVVISSGGAQRLANLAAVTTDSQTGALAASITGINGEISDLQSRISDWNTKLADQQQALEKQYADLETALGTLKSQSSSLSSALSGLTSSTSS